MSNSNSLLIQNNALVFNGIETPIENGIIVAGVTTPNEIIDFSELFKFHYENGFKLRSLFYNTELGTIQALLRPQ